MNLEKAEEIGKKVKEARQKKGFTQEFVAKEIGCSRPMIIYFEKGERDLKWTEVMKLQKLLKVKLSA